MIFPPQSRMRHCCYGQSRYGVLLQETQPTNQPVYRGRSLTNASLEKITFFLCLSEDPEPTRDVFTQVTCLIMAVNERDMSFFITST
jgi:hypothetical protein